MKNEKAYFSRPMVLSSLKTWSSNIVIPIGDYVISFSGDDGNCGRDGEKSIRHYLMIWHKDNVDKDLTEELGFESYGDYNLTKVIDAVNRRIIKDRVKVLKYSKESIRDANDRQQAMLHDSFGFGSKEEMEEHDRALGWIKPPKKQVDFNLLKDNFNIASVFFEKYMPNRPELRENFNLFVEMMKKSSSFAHKAHKELKKLS